MPKKYLRIMMIATVVLGVSMLASNMLLASAVRPIGDVNGDGKVDMSDIALVGSALGSRTGLPRWKPELDLNGDNVINIADVIIVATQYGEVNS